MSTSAEKLNDGQKVAMILAISEAMLRQVREPMYETRYPHHKMGVQALVEDIRRKGLLGFCEGMEIGSRLDDGSIEGLRGELEGKVKVIEERGNAVDLDQLPRRIVFGDAADFVYYRYVLMGLQAGRTGVMLEVKVPLGGPALDCRFNRALDRVLGANGGYTPNG